MIDYSISLGAIIQTVVIFGGGLVALGVLKRTVGEMETEIVEIKKDYKDLSKTVAQIAVQDARINRLEEDMRDLRHGRGLIVNGSSPRDQSV